MLPPNENQAAASPEVTAPIESNPAAASSSAPAADQGGAQGEGAAAPAAGATEGSPTPGEGDPAAAPVAPYKPKRTKFKVMDQEKDVPKWMLDAFKDENTEKEALELLEKGHGLEHVKADRETTRQQRDTYKQHLEKITKDIGSVKSAYARGDIDMFLNQLQIPHERMLQWALDKVTYSQLPPEQQRIHDERTQAQRQAYLAEQQAAQAQQQLQSFEGQNRRSMFETSLERPEVKSFADAFDAKVGKPGAFKEQVQAVGELAYAQSQGKVDLTPEQAIEQAMKKFQSLVTPDPAPALQGQAADPSKKVVMPPPGAGAAKAATLPNLQGGTNSPLKSGKVKTFEELKQRAKDFKQA